LSNVSKLVTPNIQINYVAGLLKQRFSNFFDYGPLFSSGIVGALADPTLVTVKFTAKYSNSSVMA